MLAGTSVFFDGTASPLLYAAANQINAIVPYAVFGEASTHIHVLRGGQEIADLISPVAAAAPAIFTLEPGGVGPGAILNQDLTVNTPLNPAPRGSIAVLFATGAGQTDPPGTDGLIAIESWPKPQLPVSVQIGGLDAEILYSGAAPTLIAGVLQVNCRIPAEVVPGFTVPVVLKVGSAESPRGVTLSVR